MRILMIDVGGTAVKLKLVGEDRPRSFRSGPTLTPSMFMSRVRRAARDWEWDAVSIGFPAVIRDERVALAPINLGAGWPEFHFAREFGCPVKLINDAALQALACYQGGRLLFLTLGTSLGSALIADDVLVPLELGALRVTKRESIADRLGKARLARVGPEAWEKDLHDVLKHLRHAFQPQEIGLGGGNARLLSAKPADCAIRSNAHAVRGALRLWPGLSDFHAESAGSTWRIVRPAPTPRPA